MNDISLSSLPPHPDRHLHDVRAIHDVTQLRFEELGKGGSWIVIRIAAAPNSGSATAIGGAIDGTSGEMVDIHSGKKLSPADVRKGIIEEGSWELISSLSDRAPPAGGQFSWTEPRPVRLRGIDAENLYRPFAQGGAVVCQYVSRSKGSAQFRSIHLLPPSWEAAVRPAYQAFQRDRRLLSDPEQPRTDDLIRTVHDGNPILAVMAFRLLAEAQQPDASLLREAVISAQGYRRAAFVYLSLLNSTGVSEGEWSVVLSNLVDSISAVEDLRSLALGVVSARLLHPHLHVSQSLAPKLLNLQYKRSTELASEEGLDPYFRQLFEVVNVTAE